MAYAMLGDRPGSTVAAVCAHAVSARRAQVASERPTVAKARWNRIATESGGSNERLVLHQQWSVYNDTPAVGAGAPAGGWRHATTTSIPAVTRRALRNRSHLHEDTL
jgi:hypothetical protein